MMVDARLPPFPPLAEKPFSSGHNHSSSSSSPANMSGEDSPSIKKELAFSPKDSPSGADYEYLERRLREFGTHKASPPQPIMQHLSSSPVPIMNNASRGESDLISLARAVESSNGCKLAKCVVCDRGLPESFHMQKPVSWLSVCKLAMWALTMDGAAFGRKWFSLGRDICPFVEVHKYVCGREFTPNWKTTIGITMSTYAKRANMFIAGNPNELGLGYYMLPEDATDPYLESTPLIIGRHYRTPNPHSNSRATTPTLPPSPTQVPTTPLSAPSTPPPHSAINARPSTPPPRGSPSTPHHQISTPARVARPTTPPPQLQLPPLPPRASTPPPIQMHQQPVATSPRDIHLPRAQSPHPMSSGNLHPSIVGVPSALIPAVNSPMAEMSTEVSSYMNDPACLMGVIRMRRKRFNGEMQRRAIGERKHTTDTERQLLLDYYDKFGTCTTVPEFVELQQRLGWDAHRTKIWLYNRKTYHHHRPGEKRKKPRTSSPTPEGASSYDGDSDDELFYGDENDVSANNSPEENDRDKNDMMDEEHQGDYILELEQMISSLKHQLEAEIASRKAETKKGQANADRISELELALARAGPRQEPTEANSETALLRTQVELYFNDLREEKKKRAQEEIKALDYLAQINTLNLRITTLEKALLASSGGAKDPDTRTQKPDAEMADAPKPDAQTQSTTQTPAHQFDAQGRKVFAADRTLPPSQPTAMAQ